MFFSFSSFPLTLATVRGKPLTKIFQRTVMPKPLLFCFCCAVSLERWCRLRGNLLFYFKSREQWSEPLGVIILEQCTVRVDPPSNHVPYGFSIGKYYQILSPFSNASLQRCIDDTSSSSSACMHAVST